MLIPMYTTATWATSPPTSTPAEPITSARPASSQRTTVPISASSTASRSTGTAPSLLTCGSTQNVTPSTSSEAIPPVTIERRPVAVRLRSNQAGIRPGRRRLVLAVASVVIVAPSLRVGRRSRASPPIGQGSLRAVP
jgi:hypothetical protein